MKKKIIVGIILSTVAAVSVFAASNACDSSKKSANGGHGHHKMMKHQKGFNLQRMLQALNVTPQQQTKIDIVIKKHRNNKVEISDAFSKTGFDKQKFIELSSNKRENMIKSRANMIEGIYKVLTDEQKLQLKVLMDIKMNKKQNMMNKGKNIDKHSYGRG